MPTVPGVAPVEPARQQQGPTGRDTERQPDETEGRERRPAVEVSTSERREPPPAASIGGVVNQSLVIERRPMSVMDVTAESGRVSTRVTEFEARVLANDPDEAADAPNARFPPLQLNRFRPAGADLVDPAAPEQPAVGTAADIGRRMFLLPSPGADRLSG